VIKATFKADLCLISNPSTHQTLLIGKSVNNIYMLNICDIESSITCLLSKNDDSWLWHRRADDEENSSELPQRNNQLIQKFNQLNLSDKESSEEATEQEVPTHGEVPPAPRSNADLPREWRIPRELSM